MSQLLVPSLVCKSALSLSTLSTQERSDTASPPASPCASTSDQPSPLSSQFDPTLKEGNEPAPSTVTWDGPDDPLNPKNWSTRQKWTTSLLISLFAFVSPLSSSITAPALPSISSDLGIPLDPAARRELVTSIFLLAYAVGPFVLAPLSEVWGRMPVIRGGNLVFIVFTALCGCASSEAQILAFRLLAGLGGGASVGMGSGVLADCWRPEERGRGLMVYQLGPVLGPAIGPIAGGYISQYASWRWCFWSIVMLNVAVQVAAAFLLAETYAPRLLLLKARALRARTGDANLRTEWETADGALPALLRVALSRPWVMLATQPIVQVLAVYQAFNFGMLYLLISSFPALWEGRYGMPRTDASLNYLSLALGALAGIAVCGPATDAVHARLKRAYKLESDEVGVPEFRLPLMVPPSILTPLAIFLYAWSAEAKTHFLVPNIGAALFSASSIISYQCISAYIADSYGVYTASASAACCFLRSMAAFSFPLIAPGLFGGLGYGIGGSILGIVAVVLGVPAPFLLWTYGWKLRGASRFCGGSGV